MNIEMNAILKSKSMRLLSALLAVLMIVAMLPTSAFAWSAEEGTKCTSTYGDKYLGSDGDNYYSKAGNTLFYNDDGSFYVSYHSGGVARYKYLMIDSNGTSHHVYCIESGVSYNYSDTYNSTSGKNSKYFQNLPVTAQYGIMMALMYGWHDGASSPVAGTNVDDFIYATQCIIWEYQQQIRTSPTSLASANGVEADLFYATLKDRPAEKCYDWILEQMSRHYVVPSFSSRNQSNAQTYTMMYDQANDNYSITLTDEDIKITLYVLCESVSARMREYGFVCDTVQLGVRDNELQSYERQGKFSYPNRTAKALFEKAFELYKRNHLSGKPVRSLSVRACRLSISENEQLSLLPDVAAIQKQEELESAVDALRGRFGPFSIRRGILLADRQLSGLNPKDDHIIHPESFFKS